jgi:hypothetical protein
MPAMAPRGTMTIIVSLFFLSGIQLIFIGMLGEYITSIHNQVRKRPLVVERELINIPPRVHSGIKAGALTSPDHARDPGAVAGEVDNCRSHSAY